MISPALYPYYLSYGLVAVALLLIHLRVRSNEPVVITTKEFRRFQSSYVTGYGLTLMVRIPSPRSSPRPAFTRLRGSSSAAHSSSSSSPERWSGRCGSSW